MHRALPTPSVAADGYLARGAAPGMTPAAVAEAAQEAALVAQAYACAFTKRALDLPGLGGYPAVEPAGGDGARTVAVRLLRAGCAA